jgi:hypothetical protein
LANIALKWAKSRWQRVVVVFDRALEKGREGELLVIGKVRRHNVEGRGGR